MPYPLLVSYDTEDEYRAHFEREYCKKVVRSFDKINVRFRKNHFDHCFFETVIEKDDTFSKKRAERIDWIKAALKDPLAELYVGWDSKKKRPAFSRRVALVQHNYVVIFRFTGKKKAEFVTAFVAGQRTLSQIKSNPK